MQRVEQNEWSKRALDYNPRSRKEWGRHSKSWIDGVKETTNFRTIDKSTLRDEPIRPKVTGKLIIPKGGQRRKNPWLLFSPVSFHYGYILREEDYKCGTAATENYQCLKSYEIMYYHYKILSEKISSGYVLKLGEATLISFFFSYWYSVSLSLEILLKIYLFN